MPSACRRSRARFPGVIRSIPQGVGDAVTQGETIATVESNESLRTYDITAPLTGVVTQRQCQYRRTDR